MPLRMFHECLGNLGVVFYCLGMFWGLLEGVSVLSEVSGSAFYSNLIYINCALIKSLTFSKRRGGPRCPKYQNVPTSWSFWPIGNPWERFQSWDIRVYFIPVPDDHTVPQIFIEQRWATVYRLMCNRICISKQTYIPRATFNEINVPFKR